MILVLWCCHHGGSAGRHTDLEDVQPFEFLCSFWKSSSSVFPMTIAASIIGAATQLLLALLRSYFGAATQLFWRCYAAIIGAATQLSLVRLRSYHWCGYAAIIMCNHSHSEFLCSFSKCFPRTACRPMRSGNRIRYLMRAAKFVFSSSVSFYVGGMSEK